MLWYVAAAYALDFLNGAKSTKAQERAQIEANKKTAQGYIRQMNYTFQNAEIQRQSLFASAVDELTKVRRQATRQESSILAAVGEAQGYGRTANMLTRSARNGKARTAGSIAQNYRTKMNEIDLNKEAALISTKNAIDSIPSVYKKSNLSYLTDLASTAFKAYTTSLNLEAASAGRNPKGEKPNDPSVHGVDLEQASYLYDGAVGVDLDSASKTYDNPYSFFSTNSLFNINPVASYYSGVGLNTSYKYDYGGARNVGGDYRWQTRLLV